MLRELKRKPHRIVGFSLVNEQDTLQFVTTLGSAHTIYPLELTKSDRYSNGSYVIDSDEQGEIKEVWEQAVYNKVFDNDDS